jgi:hypothetical protein
MRKPKIEVPDIFPDTLLFMLDYTGHETLAGNHTVYGLGGIALRAENNQPQLWPAWKNLRALVNGDPEIPLHAFEFGQRARACPKLYQPLGDFFREHRFVRLAVTATVKTSLPDHLVLMQPVILTLKNTWPTLRQARAAAPWPWCSRVPSARTTRLPSISATSSSNATAQIFPSSIVLWRRKIMNRP